MDEGVTIIEGAAYGDSITDPDPGTGWSDDGLEISDFCEWVDVQNDKFGKKSYTTEAMYSNASEFCVQEYQ